MRIVFAACHIGQVKALKPVIDLLVERGNYVALYLDKKQPAMRAWDSGQLKDFRSEIQLLQVTEDGTGLCENSTEDLGMIARADRVLVTLSPTQTHANLERLFMKEAILKRIPVYGYSEVPCGHLAPIWSESLHEFHRLFVAQKTPDLESRTDVIEVGCDTPLINPVRALQTKSRLGISEAQSFVWYSGGPYHQAGVILQQLVTIVAQMNCTAHNIQVVFSRHSRDNQDPKSYAAYEVAVKIAKREKVVISENSLDHPLATTNVQRTDLVPYSLLLEACTRGGVIVTGHGTDGMAKAPRIGVPSILCVGDDLNPDLRSEKGCEYLPLPQYCPYQITDLKDLPLVLNPALYKRDAYLATCAENYSLQPRSPAQIIVEHLTAQ